MNTISSCLLILAASTPLMAADIVLVDGVAGFEKEWIGEAAKELFSAPDKGGQALRLIVDRKPAAYPMSQTFVHPLPVGIATGDGIVISFTARCVKPNGGTLVASCGIGREPWTPAVFKEVLIGPAWKDYVLQEVASADAPVEASRFGFHFGHQVQTLEIAKLRVVKRSK